MDRNTLQWRYNGLDGVSNHQPDDCFVNRLFRCRSKKTSKLRVTGLCAGISQVTGEFPAQMTSNAENVSIWWRHHKYILFSFRHIKCLMIYFVVTDPRRSRICSLKRKCYLRNQGLCCSTTWSVTQRLILSEIWPFPMYVYKTSSHFTICVKRIAAWTKRTAICWRNFKCIFQNENVWISITISLKFVPKGGPN